MCRVSTTWPRTWELLLIVIFDKDEMSMEIIVEKINKIYDE